MNSPNCGEAYIIKNLIDRREICINDLILSELIPSIRVRKEKELEDLLYLLPRVPMQNGVLLLSMDKHFELMANVVPLQLYPAD